MENVNYQNHYQIYTEIPFLTKQILNGGGGGGGGLTFMTFLGPATCRSENLFFDVVKIPIFFISGAREHIHHLTVISYIEQ